MQMIYTFILCHFFLINFFLSTKIVDLCEIQNNFCPVRASVSPPRPSKERLAKLGVDFTDETCSSI